jgi:ribosomal protein S18 acetylase RimI-like enzyme
VTKQFGVWDLRDQDERFEATWDPKRYQLIIHDGTPVGAVATRLAVDHVFLAELQLLPRLQNRGIGTAVLRNVIDTAFARKLPVRLQVLRYNRARALYERLGFSVQGETEHHVHMELGSG